MNSKYTSSISRLLILTVTVLTFASLAHAQAPRLGTDYEFTRISGNSMLPTLQNGEVAVVYKAYPYRNLRVGDVVIINSEKGYNVIHRIVRRYRGGLWVTQGDNNRHEDREVLSPRNFRGLALVDESVSRYQNYLASMHQDTDRTPSQVAVADIH